ncbi:unnamed protein product, partial [Brenthis ino]
MKKYCIIFCVLNVPHFVMSLSQHEVKPEINDQFETTTVNEKINQLPNVTDENNEIPSDSHEKINKTEIVKTNKSIISNVFQIITVPIRRLVANPEISVVLRNVGTCVVNGVMEIISFYFPAPLIPLIASAAGMVIPFEPVVTLRRRMPINSYRRALKTAVNGFLNTFDSYKVDNFNDDPFMTRKFNRRFMNDVPKEEKKDTTKMED